MKTPTPPRGWAEWGTRANTFPLGRRRAGHPPGSGFFANRTDDWVGVVSIVRKTPAQASLERATRPGTELDTLATSQLGRDSQVGLISLQYIAADVGTGSAVWRAPSSLGQVQLST